MVFVFFCDQLLSGLYIYFRVYFERWNLFVEGAKEFLKFELFSLIPNKKKPSGISRKVGRFNLKKVSIFEHFVKNRFYLGQKKRRLSLR
jgi:hypothetical protein